MVDAADDPLGRCVPVVERLGIGTFVGVPLVLPDGAVYGTLCALDRVPSPLGAESVAALQVLARLVAHEVGHGRRVTAAREAGEERFRALVEQASDLISIADADGIRRYASPSFERALGYHPAELVGRPITAIGHPDDAAEAQRFFVALAAQPGAAGRIETRVLRRDGATRWLEAVATNRLDDPTVAGIVISSRDVTERKAAEEALRAREEEARGLAAAAARQAQEIDLLERVRIALAREVELPVLFRTVVEATAETFGYTQVSLYLCEGEELVLQHQVGYDRVLERIPVSRGISGRVVRTGDPVLLADVATDPAFLGAIEGVTSEVCVPLRDRGEVAGTFNLESIGGVRLGERDLRLMVALAEHVGVAIGGARVHAEARASEARFRSLVQNAADVITVLEPDGVRRYVSPAVGRMLGFRPEELAGANVLEMVHPDDAAHARAFLEERLRNPGAAATLEIRLRHRDGHWLWAEVTATNLLDDPHVQGLVLNTRDITERRALAADIRRHADDQAALLRVSQAATSSLELRAVLAEIARATLGTAGAECCAVGLWRPETGEMEVAAEATVPEWPGTVPSGTRRPLGAWPVFARACLGHEPLSLQGNDPSLTADERRHFAAEGVRSLLLVPLSAGDAPLGALILFSRLPHAFGSRQEWLGREVAAQTAQAIHRARLQEALRERADTDGLTGVLNHRALQETLDRELVAAAERGGSLALLLVDLDDFKLLNDTHGHLLGDRVLRRAADLLRANVGEGNHVGRYGGDEFVAVLPGVHAEVARRLADGVLREASATAIPVEGLRVPLRMSLGVACFPADGATRSDLIAAADAAMYGAKEGGGGRVGVVRRVAGGTGSGVVGGLAALLQAVDHKDRYTKRH
ncbi:MAG: PAS domain S-box protein [Chloroflexota bacterium]|nr:PAS domain S-box protein [Chloroflexota bacterium]